MRPRGFESPLCLGANPGAAACGPGPWHPDKGRWVLPGAGHVSQEILELCDFVAMGCTLDDLHASLDKICFTLSSQAAAQSDDKKCFELKREDSKATPAATAQVRCRACRGPSHRCTLHKAPQALGPSPRQGLSPPALHETAQVENPFFDFAGKPYTTAMALQNSFVHVPHKDKSDRLTHICELLAKHCKPHQHITLTILLVHLRSVDFGPLRRSPDTLAPSQANTCGSGHPPPSLPGSNFSGATASRSLVGASYPRVPRTPIFCTCLRGRSASTGATIPYITDQQGHTWADVLLPLPLLLLATPFRRGYAACHPSAAHPVTKVLTLPHIMATLLHLRLAEADAFYCPKRLHMHPTLRST